MEKDVGVGLWKLLVVVRLTAGSFNKWWLAAEFLDIVPIQGA